MYLTKETPAVEHEHFQPPDEDLALIQQYARRELKAEDVYCGAMHACNTKLDRAGERFTKAYLQRFAETIVGKPTLEGHDTTKKPNGRIYKAEVLPEGDGWFLKTYYYVRADSPLVTDIELGIAKDVSIGYNASRRVCDLDGKEWHPFRSGKDYCEHWPLEEYDGQPCTLTYCDTAVTKAEAMEMSWVWVGCQRGAEAIAKSTDGREVAFLKDLIQRLHGTSPSGTGETQVKTLEEVQNELLEAKAAHEKDRGEHAKQLQELKAQAEEGTAYRTFLRTEIARFAGLLKEDGIWASWAANEKASVEALMPVYEALGKRVDEKFSTGQAGTNGAPDPQDTQTRPVPVPWFRRRAA